MRALFTALAGLAIVAGLASLPGCAASCRATPDKLAHLSRGMRYDKTVEVMGCRGRLVSARTPASGDYSTVEWDGPDQRFFQRTQLDFQDGRLLSYTTERRAGL